MDIRWFCFVYDSMMSCSTVYHTHPFRHCRESPVPGVPRHHPLLCCAGPIYPWRIQSYGRLILTRLGYIHGKCYHDHSIHTDPMGILNPHILSNIILLGRYPIFSHVIRQKIHKPCRTCQLFLQSHPFFSRLPEPRPKWFRACWDMLGRGFPC